MGTPFLGIPDGGDKIDRLLAEQAQRFGIPPHIIDKALAGPRGVPTTRARTTHAYSLQTARGQTIGAVFRSEARQSRDIKFKYEVDVNANGQPADIVPGVMTAQTFSITRFDLFDEILEEVFGEFEIEMLTDQTRGWRIREVWRAPSSILNSRGRRYEYAPAYFSDLGRSQGADDDRLVRVNAQLVWLNKRKIG